MQETEEYFSPDFTIPAALQVIASIFGLEIAEVDTRKLDYLAVWHESVKVYTVRDKAVDKGAGFLGRLYLDLFWRPEKKGTSLAGTWASWFRRVSQLTSRKTSQRTSNRRFL